MDEASQTGGIKKRTAFLRRALDHYLTHLGDTGVAALFTSSAAL